MLQEQDCMKQKARTLQVMVPVALSMAAFGALTLAAPTIKAQNASTVSHGYAAPRLPKDVEEGIAARRAQLLIGVSMPPGIAT
jgi:hypothetical protein